MSVQQLGSIYERLLEREPVFGDELGRIVVRPNQLRAQGQRQLLHATGARRPDRRPNAEAAGRGAARRVQERKSEELKRDRRPKVRAGIDELRCKLDPAEAVLDLKVLDPAMGSGHFLVTAVDFLSDDR